MILYKLNACFRHTVEICGYDIGAGPLKGCPVSDKHSLHMRFLLEDPESVLIGV